MDLFNVDVVCNLQIRLTKNATSSFIVRLDSVAQFQELHGTLCNDVFMTLNVFIVSLLLIMALREK